MPYLNSVTIIGFVGADLEQRQARNNSGSNFTVLSVATQRSWKNTDDQWGSKTEWHRVCVFRPRLAEYVATTIKKGARARRGQPRQHHLRARKRQRQEQDHRAVQGETGEGGFHPHAKKEQVPHKAREFFSSAGRRSLLLIAVRPRNSTIRCFLLYFSRTPALPFAIVAPVSAQISKVCPRPPAVPLRRRSVPLLTTHYPLSTLFLPALCFHILTNCFSRNPFILTTIPIAPGCGGTNKSTVFRYLPPLSPLFALFFEVSPFVFNRLQPLFAKYRGWGIPNATTAHPRWG
jgi:single-stranded DNA-binding protein